MARNGFRVFPLVIGVGAAFVAGVSAASVLDDGEPINLYAADAGVRFVGFDVAALPDNHFAVTWLERNAADQTESLRVARFDQNGEPLGDALVISETFETENYPNLSDPVIAASPAGNSVVVWNSGNNGGTSECRTSVLFQLINSDGTASSSGLSEHAAGGSNCYLDVAMNEQGLFSLSMLQWPITQYVVQVFGQDGMGISAPLAFRRAPGPEIPLAVALQESSGMAVWSQQEEQGTVLLAHRYDLAGYSLGDGDFRFDNNAHDADGLYQGSVSLDATANGGYLGAWLQSEDDGQQLVYSQHIQRWRADGTAAGSARVGGTAFESSTDRMDLDAGAGDSAILAWTHSRDDGARERYATVVYGHRAVRDNPTVIAQSEAGLFESSALTKVALADDTAMVLWYEQDDEDSGPVLKARIGTLLDKTVDSGGGGGGSTGPMVLLAALAMLFRKKKPGGNIRPA
ncbi:MAG: hypothetical protein MK005_05180 [Alcanivorax sp.]|nr:hypothetical protein [Alcanivorax sp.]